MPPCPEEPQAQTLSWETHRQRSSKRMTTATGQRKNTLATNAKRKAETRLMPTKLLAILDENAVTIHGHSVKGINRVVRCYENANSTSSWFDIDEYETQSGVSQNQLCFVHIFLILDTLYICYQKGDFPTGLVMKRCPNNSTFSLFWRLSVDINGISVYWYRI